MGDNCFNEVGRRGSLGQGWGLRPGTRLRLGLLPYWGLWAAGLGPVGPAGLGPVGGLGPGVGPTAGA